MRFPAPFRIRLLLLLPVLTVLLCAPAALCDEPAPQDMGVTVSADRELRIELEAVFAKEKQQLAALNSEFEAAVDDGEALRIQRRIAEVRQSTELAMLSAQVRHARSLGRIEQAEAIEAVIAELRDPQRAARKARPVESRP